MKDIKEKLEDLINSLNLDANCEPNNSEGCSYYEESSSSDDTSDKTVLILSNEE